METKTVIYELRTKHGLSQDELAEKVFVTRQAVSRWENGETVPNTETLKSVSYTHLPFVHCHVPAAFSVTISAHKHDIYLRREAELTHPVCC